MIIYLVRHGRDDDTVRGGWSQHPLTLEGINQAEMLAERLAGNISISHIYSSDLCRAMQTAKIIANKIKLPILPLPQFRETNNGDLAGIKNDIALVRYPGLFWNRLGWEQCYPNGESPRQFYERIVTAWSEFSQEIVSRNKDVVLVTHSGVIHVILSIIEGRTYNNTEKQRHIGYTEIIKLTYDNEKFQLIEE